MSSRRHQTSCPRSTSTASDRRRTRGHDKAARPPDSERLHANTRKLRLQGARQPTQGAAFRAETASGGGSEPLIRRATLAEVPLTGLSFGFPPAVGSRLRPPLGCRGKNLGKIRGTHAGCKAHGLCGGAGSFRRGTYPPHETCGHARGANTRGLRVDECPRCRPPPARKKRVESCGHARGWIPAGFAQPTIRRLRPPLGLSGSPAPS
jgi:hypothetical protein